MWGPIASSSRAVSAGKCGIRFSGASSTAHRKRWLVANQHSRLTLSLMASVLRMADNL